MLIVILFYQPLQNGDFENWSYISTTIPFAWDTIGKSGASCQWLMSSASRAGNYSLQVINTNNVNGYDCAIAQPKVVSGSNTYYITFYVVDTSSSMRAHVYVRCYNSSGTFLDSGFPGDSSINFSSWQWQAIGGSYTTPSDCYYLEAQVRYYGTGTIYTDVAYMSSTFSGPSLVESFDYYPPSGWDEVDVGVSSSGLLRRRTSACPFGSDGDDSCFGIKYLPSSTDADAGIAGLSYLMTDTMDFLTHAPETLVFFWRTSLSSGNLNPEDSITVEISIDDGNSWTRIWKWNGIPIQTVVAETVALDAYNYESQVLLRFAFYKNSTTSSVTSNRYFNIDSVKVLNSYVGRYNRFTNASFEQWLLDTIDIMPDHWRRRTNRRPYSNIAQLWIRRDSDNTFSGNYSLKAYYTTTQNPFVEQKIPNPFTSGCLGQPASDIDSFLIKVSARLYDNDSQGKARIGLVWYSGSSAVQTTYTDNYTVNSTSWQLFEISDTFSGSSVDTVSLRIRFYNEGTFPNADEGATIYSDSVNLTWYCFVDDVLPVDVAEVPVGSQFIQYVRHYRNFLEIAVKKPIDIDIYDIRGKRVVHRFVRDKVSLRLGSGIYIIRAGDVRKKIVLVE